MHDPWASTSQPPERGSLPIRTAINATFHPCSKEGGCTFKTGSENREFDWTLFDRLLECSSERFLDLVEVAQLNPAVDFRFADLRGLEIGDADLRDFDLTSSDLSHVNLAGANLAGVNLAGANLAGANLAGANLAGANLAGANLAGANLHNADLRQASLIGSRLDSANLIGAKLLETELAAFWNTAALLRQIGPAAVPA